MSRLCVINKIHRCVVQRRLLSVGDGQRISAVTYTLPQKCWWHAILVENHDYAPVRGSLSAFCRNIWFVKTARWWKILKIWLFWQKTLTWWTDRHCVMALVTCGNKHVVLHFTSDTAMYYNKNSWMIAGITWLFWNDTFSGCFDMLSM